MADTPRILIICNDLAYFLRHRRSISDELARRGFDVTIMTGGDKPVAGQMDGLRHVHVPIERFALNPLRDFGLAWRTYREIAARRPGAVHLFTLKPAVFSGIAALVAGHFVGKPQRILITIPGLGRLMSPGTQHTGLRGGLMRRLVRTVIRLLSSRAGVDFTFETESDRANWLQRGLIRADNSWVINGAGVDGTIFRPADRTTPRRPLRVLFASRLLRAKGLDLFVEAARRFSAAEVEFVVAGMVEPQDPDGYAPADLARDTSITFAGEVTDMAALLQSVDVVCLPTRYGEGIPRILIEAASCGRASIASDIDGCREIVKDGVSGTILAADGPAAMVDAIVKAVSTYRDDPALLLSHGKAARAVFDAGGFDQTQVIGRFIELLTGPTQEKKR